MRPLRVLQRFEASGRRELLRLRSWLEDTQNFLRLTTVVLVPIVIGGVTWLANATELLPFLLFPPLASGAYTLFTTPTSPHAEPRRFVGGLTIGATAGWLALELTTQFSYTVDGAFAVNPWAAAFGVFLTGLVTWLLDVQVPQAFSTALLVLVLGGGQFVFVVSVFVSALGVAVVASTWRRQVYDRRAELLYQTVDGDDDVLVPIHEATADSLTALAARLAGAHEAGTLVLLDVVDNETADGGDVTTESSGTSETVTVDDETAIGSRAEQLEVRAQQIEAEYDVPTDVVIARGGGRDATTVLQSARETNCDLIVAPYEAEDDQLSAFVRGLFAGEIDVIAAKLSDRRDWHRVLVPVRRAGDVAHAMLDFAGRLVGENGTVTTITAIGSETERREAESRLADLAETFDRTAETRVVRASIESYLDRATDGYDLVIVGSSTDRSKASRFVSPPTFRRLDSLDCDVAIVHRG